MYNDKDIIMKFEFNNKIIRREKMSSTNKKDGTKKKITRKQVEKKQTKVKSNKKDRGLIIAVVVVVAIILGLVAFKSLNSEKIRDVRNKNLSSSTVTELVENTSKEALKGPVKTAGKTVYITIDDGPSEFTDQMLKVLDKYNAKATFFMIDSNMKAYPEQVKNIANSTSTAGFHSVTHDVKKLYASTDAAKKEFDQCSKTYTDLTGKTSKVIRIPYGSKPYTPEASYQAMTAAGYKIWDWNVDTNDWRNTAGGIKETVKTYGNGKNVILLMHEKPQTMEAFEFMIKYYADQGYEFAAIGQNEKPRNFWMQNLNLN